MNWYSIFYWLVVADGVKSAFDAFSNIFTTLAIISIIIYAIATIYGHSKECEDKDTNKHWRRHLSWIMNVNIILMTLTWIGYMATPTKKDALLIVAGGGTMTFLTTDSAAKEVPHEVMNFLVGEIKALSAEAKVDLGIADHKKQLIDEAKKMTTDQLLEKLKADTTYAKIILNN